MSGSVLKIEASWFKTMLTQSLWYLSGSYFLMNLTLKITVAGTGSWYRAAPKLLTLLFGVKSRMTLWNPARMSRLRGICRNLIEFNSKCGLDSDSDESEKIVLVWCFKMQRYRHQILFCVYIWWLKTATVLTFILKAEERVQQDDPSLPGQTEQVMLCSQGVQSALITTGVRVPGAARIIFYDPVRFCESVPELPVWLTCRRGVFVSAARQLRVKERIQQLTSKRTAS